MAPPKDLPFGFLDGTGFEQLDPRFKGCIPGPERLVRLWTGARWCEGPAWFAAHRTLLWSDIPNNRMLRYDEVNGTVGVFREPSNNTNGHTVDRQGRLVSCEHLTRRVTRTEHDGSITVLASHWQGKRLNSPNDVVVHSDGGVWFTDPSYGILSDYEGLRADSEIGACHVYRVDPAGGEVARMTDDFVKPNGLAFSPDESLLYIADTGASHAADGPRHIRRFRVGADGRSLGGGEVFAECTNGLFDGFRLDTEDRIWTSAADGVHAYHPDGTLLGKILVPERVANVCFGGPKLNRLFICATSSLYAITLNAKGV
ncbi:SMP-30/gluconolactonase/LRE family protein [Variovorax sp. J22G73]|uniref:SMP-30/gluconolactonase/LRE family protein n=1 Tax=unclassified Variovorax TaxID=663243 RepID=UPI0025755364|nr:MULTISPECIES: SMP-30/gluconolactonase/LRE family protein [unclassified Variovorax]MDM0008825.1 SMP-30/gluconolactonase/LRE family protein [Variovorax sp. J22R203]MDM0101339.1 SMP-30/gluconolactonase/LRE family protein [Variovorax sp. J22G73]